MNNDNISIQDISKYRKPLMGFANVLIFFGHNTLLLPSLFDATNSSLCSLCQCGPDIFFLLSGMSLYFSIFNDSNIGGFYSKRLKKILPQYLLVIGLFSIPEVLLFKTSISNYIYIYSLITFFTDAILAEWFIASILVLYLLFPLFYYLINKINNQKLLFLLILFWDIVVLIVCFNSTNPIRKVWGIFASRIPSFVVGVLIGKKIKHDQNIIFSKRKALLGSVILVLIATLLLNSNVENSLIIARTIVFLPLILFAIPLAISLFKYVDNKTNKAYQTLYFLSSYTLENYLIHEKVLRITDYFILNQIMTTSIGLLAICASIVSNILAIAITLVLSIVVKKICTEITTKIPTVRI